VDRDDLRLEEISLLVRLLNGERRPATDRDTLLRLYRKNLVRFGEAGWRLTDPGAVLAVEIDERSEG